MSELARHWRILLGCVLGMAIGVTGVIPYTSGIFLPHLREAFGWTKAGISLGQSLQAYGTALAVPLVGAFVDRAGLRLPAGLGFAAFAAALFGLSFMSGPIGLFWTSMALIGLAGAACGPTIFTRAVNATFEGNRGLALSLTIGGVGIGAAVYPAVINAVIEAAGWQAGYRVLGLTVAVISPLVLLLMGKAARPVRADHGPAAVDWKVILRGAVFWKLAVAFVLAPLAVTGYLLHLVPMLREAGLTSTEAAALQSAIGLSVLVARLSAGAVADRVFAPYVAAACLGAGALAAVALAVFGPAAALPAVVLLGVALGCEVDLMSYMIARYYPLAVYGRVYGVIYGAALLGAGSGPVWIGAVADATGGYDAALFASAAMFAACTAILLTLPKFPARAT